MLLDVEDLKTKDELLGESVTQELIAEAEEYLRYQAERIGVSADAIQPTYYVKRFLALHVFREICMRKSFTGARAFGVGDMGEGKDSFAGKYNFYVSELKRLEAAMTAAALTGEAKSGGCRTVSLYRG